MVTEFDSWHPGHSTVDIQAILEVVRANSGNASHLVTEIALNFPAEHEPCPIGSDRALDHAIITAPEQRDSKLVAKLDAVAGRVLNR
jgi:5'-methylthioadenosine phosphorylase